MSSPDALPRAPDRIDPFHALQRVIERYRRDVHQVADGAGPDSLAQASAVIGGPLPPTLLRFLERWNGASLFRGALRLRSATELAPARADVPGVFLFADGPRPNERWGFTVDPQGGAAFGRWTDGDPAVGLPAAFTPLHERFDRWLASTLRALDEDRLDPDAELDARLDADPDCGFLLWLDARRLLARGEAARARRRLERATAANPELIPAWVALGEVQLATDPRDARFSLLHALRALRLPAPWPAADAPGPALIERLDGLFPAGDAGWERELERFLEEGVRDVADEREGALAEAAALALARQRAGRGERRVAVKGLEDFLARSSGFHAPPPAVDVSLCLAELLIELGRHDDAERRLRRLRELPWPAAARAQVLIGSVAVQRQEPWAESILGDAFDDLAPGRLGHDLPAVRRDRANAQLWLAERHRVMERPDEAARALALARSVAAGVEPDEMLARMALLEGDLHKQRGDGAAAEAAWRRAHDHARGDTELLQRVLLRRGDLFRMTGDEARAAADYTRAAEVYQGLELPIREGWARLRLAQLGAGAAAELARGLFKQADFAAGVVAADAITGDPTRSIAWHLERAAEHARDRANAQRARPPLVRADAERPERRLGAHRAAIAACDVRVVQSLQAWLEGASKALDRGGGRPGDPQLTRYIAAVDLLSAHRSFEAAEVLLQQLLHVRPDGAAGRALVGAMARSPNAALVDGLLEALEGGFDPAGMAAAAEVLGWRREQAAVPVLTRLLGDATPRSVRKAAVAALGRVGDPDVIDAMMPLLDVPGMEAEVGTALLLLGEWRGVDAQAQALAHPRGKDGSRSRGELVGRYGGPAYLLLLYRTVEVEGPTGIGALQGLGYLGDPRAVDRLIDVLAGRDPQRAHVASGALELITGHHEDPEESLLRTRWIEWWSKHGGRFQPGMRYRHGKLFDPAGLIERLDHDDALVRRTSYDELVIATGAQLPFDAEGPYRVQVSHRRAWAKWWTEHKGRFPGGRWSFHGEAIG